MRSRRRFVPDGDAELEYFPQRFYLTVQHANLPENKPGPPGGRVHPSLTPLAPTWGALQEAGQPGCLVLLCLYFGAFAAVWGLNRVVDDRKLAWRAHPWPAWAVRRHRPTRCLRAYPSCGPQSATHLGLSC